MSGRSKAAANKAVSYGCSRIFVRSVKDIGRRRKDDPKPPSSDITKSSSDTQTVTESLTDRADPKTKAPQLEKGGRESDVNHSEAGTNKERRKRESIRKPSKKDRPHSEKNLLERHASSKLADRADTICHAETEGVPDGKEDKPLEIGEDVLVSSNCDTEISNSIDNIVQDKGAIAIGATCKHQTESNTIIPESLVKTDAKVSDVLGKCNVLTDIIEKDAVVPTNLDNVSDSIEEHAHHVVNPESLEINESKENKQVVTVVPTEKTDSKFEKIETSTKSSVIDESKDCNKEVIEVSAEDWSFEIANTCPDNSDICNEHSNREIFKDSGCVSDFNNNRSSLKSLGSLSSHGSAVIDDIECGKNSDSEFVEVWKEDKPSLAAENNIPVKTNDKKSLTSDKKACSDDKKICLEQQANTDNVVYHSTPKKYRSEEFFISSDRLASSPVKRPVIPRGSYFERMSVSRYTDYNDNRHRNRFSSNPRGGANYNRSENFSRHNDYHRGQFGKYQHSELPSSKQSDFQKPPRFRGSVHHAFENPQRDEKPTADKSLPYGRYNNSSQYGPGYRPANEPYQSNWRSESNEMTSTASPLMELHIKTPENYNKTERRFVHGARGQTLKLTLPESEDWLTELQEVETNSKQDTASKDSHQIDKHENQPDTIVNSMNIDTTSNLPSSNTARDNHHMLENLSIKDNIEPYIPPLPPTPDSFESIEHAANDVDIADVEDGNDSVKITKSDEGNVMKESAPYLPPIPDEILQGYDNDDSQSGELKHCSDQIGVNTNVPVNADNKKSNVLDTLIAGSMNEDSNSVSSLMKVDDPCAYSIFGGTSTSEADVSDFYTDDGKIPENLASQNSDGDPIQGVNSYENESDDVQGSFRDYASSGQFYPPGYNEYMRYWYGQQQPDKPPGYLPENMPYDYQPNGLWGQNLWTDEMSYYWSMYYSNYYRHYGAMPEDLSYNHNGRVNSSYNYETEQVPKKLKKGDTNRKIEYVNTDGNKDANTAVTMRATNIQVPDQIEESKTYPNYYSNVANREQSSDISSNCYPRLSNYWSNRMERWVQGQHSIAEQYQDSHVIGNNLSSNSTAGQAAKPNSAYKSVSRSTSVVRRTLGSENVDEAAECKMEDVIQQIDNAMKDRPAYAKKVKKCQDGERNPDIYVTCEPTDCSCKPSDVVYVVLRMCNCEAGEHPTLQQIIPNKHVDDRNLHTDSQSCHSLEPEESIGGEKQSATRAPGFLIQPLSSNTVNKHESEKLNSVETADKGTSKDNTLLIGQNTLQPPPGFSQTYTNLFGRKDMDNSEVEGDKVAEMNNNMEPKRLKQPLSLRELIKQAQSFRKTEFMSEDYSPPDQNDNYSNMPDCVRSSALHLDEAVKSMENAEEIEMKLEDALQVVNKTILDIQKNICEQENKDKQGIKQNLNLQNNNVVDKSDFSHKKADCNVNQTSISHVPPSLILNERLHNENLNYRIKDLKSIVADSERRVKSLSEDTSMTPPYEIPENEMMETDNKDNVRPDATADKAIPFSIPPHYLSSYHTPSPYRFHMRPPFFPLPRERVNVDMRTPPPCPYPSPYQMATPPPFLRNPWFDIDLRSRQVGPYFDSSLIEGHPRPRLSNSISNAYVDGKQTESDVKMTPESKKTQKSIKTPSSALKLIELYDTSDISTDELEDGEIVDASTDFKPLDAAGSKDTNGLNPDEKKSEIHQLHKKLKKDTDNWSPDYNEEISGQIRAHSSLKQCRTRKLKQKTLKSFRSMDRPSTSPSSMESDYNTSTLDKAKHFLQKKSLADIISAGRKTTGNKPGVNQDHEISPLHAGADNLPKLSPLSPFWCMYQPGKTSALTGHSPAEITPPNPLSRRSFGGFQQPSQSTERSHHRYSISPKIYPASETDSEKGTIGNKKDSFKRFHNFGVKYIDTHCHLDFLFNRERFTGSFQAYMDKHSETFPDMFEGCVAVFCNPATFKPNSGLWLDVAKESNVWIAMGCHPKMATDFTENAEYGLRECMKHNKCIALGEIGLDYSGTFYQHEETQKRVFRCQLKMAVELGKPLVIHSRDAEDDCIEILKEIVPRNWKIHCHCFTNAYRNAQLWIDAFPNLYIGVTPLVTYHSATPTHDLARQIPLEKLLLETDAPYFIPRCIPRDEMPLSNPGVAVTVAREIAKYQNVPVAKVLRQCRLNTKDMYGI